MEKPRALAYKLSKEFNLSELAEISGGAYCGSIRGKIFIPTVKVTGRPLLPDTECDSHSV